MADNSTLPTAVSFIETALQEIKELMENENKDNTLSFEALKDIYSRGFQNGYERAVQAAEDATLEREIDYSEGPFNLCCSLSELTDTDIVTDELPSWDDQLYINTEYGDFASLMIKYNVDKPNDNQ